MRQAGTKISKGMAGTALLQGRRTFGAKARIPQSRETIRAEEDRAIYRALRVLERRLGGKGDVLADPEAAHAWSRLHLASRDIEVFAALFLDSQHRVIAWEELAQGSLSSSSVYPREVVKRALANNAAAVIFAHNHPSGTAEPSAADRTLTNRLQAALETVDIRVLDHLVIGSGRPASFAERGWL